MRVDEMLIRKHTADCKRVRPTLAGNQWLFYIFCFVITLMLTSCEQWYAYGENKRRENFNRNFEAFQKLESMQREDINSISGISLDRVSGLNPKKISGARLSEYRKLMKQAGLESFGYVSDEPKKRMVRFHEDMDLVDFGYVYMEYPPPKVFTSRRDCKPIMPSNSCYIALRKNWYMFSENFRLEQEDAK